MAAEIGAFAVEPLVANWTVDAIAAGVRSEVVVAHLFVGEGFGAAGMSTFPGQLLSEVGRGGGAFEGTAGVGAGESGCCCSCSGGCGGSGGRVQRS